MRGAEIRAARPTRPVRRPGAGGGQLGVNVCRDGGRFGALTAEWQDLYGRCRHATPFQSHAWLASWWQAYGTEGRLRAVLVHAADGRLVAAAPLWLAPGPVPSLTLLGGPITDYGDVLVDDGCPEALPALAGALAGLARGAVIDLREVPPGAAAERLYALWDGPRRRLPDSVCMELPALPVDDLLARLPGARAQRARAKLRKIDREGVTAHPVAPHEVPQALRRLLDLHRRQWAGRPVTPEHLTDRFHGHLTRAVRAMAASGQAQVTEYRLADDVVAVDLALLSPRLVGGYLYGADPVLRSLKVDVAALLLRNCARTAAGTGRGTLSLLRGEEPYKHHWRPDAVANQRLLLARRRTAPALWLRAGYAGGRRWAAERLRDQTWVRRLRGGGGER